MSGRGGVSFVSQGDQSVVGKVFHNDFFQGQYWRQLFPSSMWAVGVNGYGDPTGATGDINFAHFMNGMSASYHIKGAGQTILAPFPDSTGFQSMGLDQAAGEGVEYLLGRFATASNPFGITVDGGRPAAFNRVEFDTDTVANVAEAAVGFRKAEAFQANLDDYDELVCLNLQGGDVYTETILNGGTTSSVDTGLNVADDTRVTLEVRITEDGRATFYVNNAKVGPAFQFDTAEVLVPFVFWLQVTGGAAFRWYDAACGRLWHERKDPLVQAITPPAV